MSMSLGLDGMFPSSLLKVLEERNSYAHKEEELVTFVNKLSVVTSCSQIVLICFIREQR